MKIDLLTLFPEMCEAVLSESIVGRARAKGVLDIRCRQIRDYTLNKQKQVDDYPYGGGRGLVMNAQPIADCFRAVCRERHCRPHLIYMSPQGAVLTQKRAVELAAMPGICVLCGHYEGVDERVLEALVDEQISIGDYVLTGGELPALTLVDCVARLVPGVLSDEICFTEESHFSGLLEYPQYTRPAVWEGRGGPRGAVDGTSCQHRGMASSAGAGTDPAPPAGYAEGAALSPEDRACLERLEAALREKAAKDNGGCEQK